MNGRHLLKSWCSTQKNITLSSGEAELVAAVKTATEAIGLSRLAWDWGLPMEAWVHVDSSAAIGMIDRRGSGRLRHIKIGHLWIQEMAEEGEIRVRKVLGDENPADLMTKHLVERKVSQFMQAMGFEFRPSRACRHQPTAHELSCVSTPMQPWRPLRRAACPACPFVIVPPCCSAALLHYTH